MDPIFKKIIVPIDGSDASIHASRKAIHLAQNLNAKIIVMHVINRFEITKYIEISHDEEAVVKKELQDYGLKYLSHVKDLAKGAEVPVEVVLAEGIPAEEIVRTAKKENADLIVIGSSGGTGFRRRLLGSTADRVLRWSTGVPVLVITF
ncbi:MAG: universal stress protein [Candidatus Methanofastidiosa archaeon]|jgi:nucleotide-binding universal stress UspA family protein|nr:universal stress protein [Candidatus Methanofastidiosa archaeon]MDD4280900.1 universal stress protein [Candidatus Methanofastidiosa archaeon]